MKPIACTSEYFNMDRHGVIDICFSNTFKECLFYKLHKT